MTASGLRQEAQRGRLRIERIAGKDFTILLDVEEMRAKCRVEARKPAYGSNHPAEMATGGSLKRASGSSEMDQSNAALVAARMRLERLKDS